MTDGFLFLVLQWDVSIVFEVQVQRCLHFDLMILQGALQMIEIGVLWQRGSLVVEETRHAIWFLDLVLGFHDLKFD
jgi:hypothetical protein